MAFGKAKLMGFTSSAAAEEQGPVEVTYSPGVLETWAVQSGMV